MNYNNSITLTFSKNRKGKFVIERDLILGLFTNIERDYSSSADKETTFIRVTFDTGDLIGIEARHTYREQKYLDIPIEEELSVVLGLLKGSKAAKVLHGQ